MTLQPFRFIWPYTDDTSPCPEPEGAVPQSAGLPFRGARGRFRELTQPKRVRLEIVVVNVPIGITFRAGGRYCGIGKYEKSLFKKSLCGDYMPCGCYNSSYIYLSFVSAKL